jgi:hypothetical protein
MWFLSSVATLHAVLYDVVVRYGTVLSTTLVLRKELFAVIYHGRFRPVYLLSTNFKHF